MRIMLASTAFALMLGAFAVVAVKDDEYYRAGMSNPNVDLKMYWADAHNVLDDLSQFSSLYIQYQNCAWAQNKNQYSDDEESGSGDETDYWYIDATPQYAANVAYSLYGSLTGESFSGCNEDTFINSFTTNGGFEPFAQALYYAGVTDTDYSGTYSSECAGGAGVACDYQVGFAYVSYSSDACDPYYATGVTDSMGYMNSAFQSAQCVQIYNGDSQNSNNNNNNNYQDNGDNRDLQQENKEEDSEKNNEDRNLQDNYGYGYGYNNNYYNNYYNYYGTALSVLYYSNACFIQNFWAPNGGCPDPFGKLQLYQSNFNKGARKSMKVDTYVTYRVNMETGVKYVKIGALCFMTATLLFIFEQLVAYRGRKRARLIKTSKLGYSAGRDNKTPADRDALLKKKRSVVGLVKSATGKMKKAAKSSVASLTKNKCACGEDEVENDGVMNLDDISDNVKADTGGSYEAPTTITVVEYESPAITDTKKDNQ